jgi:hypothetical protein
MIVEVHENQAGPGSGFPHIDSDAVKLILDAGFRKVKYYTKSPVCARRRIAVSGSRIVANLYWLDCLRRFDAE